MRHAFDGQNTFVPSSDTIAGISVRPATRVVATAMARAGPSDLNRPSVDRVSARNAMMTAPAAEAMASPTRVTALIIAVFGSSPSAQPFPVAEHQEQDVVGADAEEHHDQEGADRTVGLEVEQLFAQPIRPVAI